MALPDAQNLAYRGITSGSAQCTAWRGFFCVSVPAVLWREIASFKLYISRMIGFNLER